MPVNEAGMAIGKGSATQSTWTPERVAKLLEIWPLGASASEAAAEIGGVSRNAVIGKVHRLGLPKRACDSGRMRLTPEVLSVRAKEKRERHALNQRNRRARARGEEPAEPTPELPPVPAYLDSLNLPFADLGPQQCRFIEGDAPDFNSCGNPTAGGTSWCHHHQQIVWVKPELRRADSYDGNRRGRKVSNFSGSYEAA